MGTNSGITQEVIVLNSFGLEERIRTTSTGTKSRHTISIKAEPLIHNFDAHELGRGPSTAIAAVLVKAIKGIGEYASTATQAFRARAAREMAGVHGPRSNHAAVSKSVKKRAAEGVFEFRGKTRNAKGVITGSGAPAWVTDRYAGGRTGMKPPDQTKRLFNDSERFAEGIFVSGSGQVSQPGPHDGDRNEWTINVPANRLDPSTFKTPALFLAMVEKLQNLVPELKSIDALGRHEEIRTAIGASITDVLIQRGQDALRTNMRLRGQVRSLQWGIIRQLMGGAGVPL